MRLHRSVTTRVSYRHGRVRHAMLSPYFGWIPGACAYFPAVCSWAPAAPFSNGANRKSPASLNLFAAAAVFSKRSHNLERIMIIPLLSLILLGQGTAAPTAAQVPPAPLRLKEAVQRFPQSQIEPKVAGPISIDLNHGSRADYEALAGLAGLNIVFDADFADRALAPIHVAGEDIFEAFDRLSLMTGSFVEVLDSKTLLVSPDHATKRRENEIQVLKTIYPSYATSPQELSGLVTMLRATLQMRYLAASADMKGIILRDSSGNIAAAEKLIGQLDSSSSSQPIGFDRLGNLYSPEGNEV